MFNSIKKMTYPYIVWISIIIIVPMLLIAFYSITVSKDGSPISFKFSFEHYIRFFNEPYTKKALLNSFKLAFYTTLVCLLLGYPTALIIANKNKSSQGLLLMLFVMPMWINMLLRTYALQTLLSPSGLLNSLFGIKIYYSDTAVLIGMIYNFIPFMILPIYTAIIKVDKSLLDASKDLGASSLETFLKVTMPLTIPGIVTGITMVFLPAASSFAIPRLLGGGDYILIGNMIETQFLSSGNWSYGSALSMILIIIILLSMKVLRYFNKDDESGGALPW